MEIAPQGPLPNDITNLLKRIAAPSRDAKRGREQRTTFLILLSFSALEIGYLVYRPPTFSEWRDWLNLRWSVTIGLQSRKIR